MTLQETKKALIQYREEQGISQKQIAELMHCTQPSVSDLEHRKGCGWNSLIQYAHALELELDIQIINKLNK